MKLTELIENYSKLQKKYSLPSFDEMNSAFEIGKIKKDSGVLLKDIRRIIVDKFAYYLKLIETIVNPSQAPPMFMMLLKEITPEDKKIIDSVFSSFMEVELISYKLDVVSDDSNEVEFILKAFGVWNDKRAELLKILGILERNWKNASNSKKSNRDYFN
ncbi:hypothetical protein J4423_00675 [Candidatus Pacearchaeota archaeon]|nr:hypothetical protein [Candidatus Pacearchaeota archaeon]